MPETATYNEKIMVRGQEDERGSPVNFDRELSPQERPAMHQQVKDQQINELSDMVKELLREQQELKEQLA